MYGRIGIIRYMALRTTRFPCERPPGTHSIKEPRCRRALARRQRSIGQEMQTDAAYFRYVRKNCSILSKGIFSRLS